MSRLVAVALLGLALLAAAPAQGQIVFRSAASATATGVTPAFRSAASATTTGATLTLTKPTGVVANDVLIASIGLTPSSVAISPPAGWTLVRRTDNAGPTSNSLAVYYKVAGASEPASYAWGVSGAAFTVGGVQAFTGVDTATPIDVENGQATPAATTHATPGVTTTLANTMLVTAHAFASAATWSPPAGMTESFDRPSGANNATGMAIEGNRVLQAVAGATGAKTATASANADAGNAHLLALKPLGVSLSIATPAGVQPNDVMIAAVGFNNASAGVTPPSGWTLVRRMNNAAATSNALAVYRRSAQTGEPAAHAWTLAGGAFLVGGIQAFSGVDSANPVDVENGQTTPSATTHATPSVTTTLANTMVVTAHVLASAGTWSPPSGMTESFDRPSGANNATGMSIEGNRVPQAVAGATGAKTATASGNADAGNTHILALRRLNAPPTVSLTSPANGATFAAPASITLTATAADADGSIAKVEFFQGASLINTDTVSPYTFNWTGVPAGGYTLTAKATDNLGAVTTSSPVSLTVTAPAATLYFIHPDHLNTPRVITNASQQVVWRWDNNEAFGANMANENPGGLGSFTFNPRFPGQYFDRETNLHYNYLRDYSPEIGRYIESDPIGLRGGVNTYAYVDGNPVSDVDIFGVATTYPRGTTGACGPDGGSKFPDKFAGYSFTEACQNHDNCYAICGANKADCDLQFYSNLQRVCSRIPLLLAILGGQARTCSNLAAVYFAATATGGNNAYQTAQRKCHACNK
jgi:RHS repeat-associated protein